MEKLSSDPRKEFFYKKSLLYYLSYFMDIETINKMVLLNKHFYEIFTNDIVWHNIFHQNFTKLRIIENPETYAQSRSTKNELGKKRKRYISAVKNAKDKVLTSYRPPREDVYNIIVTGYLNYMPIESAIKNTYGPKQDIFWFFNCFFFFDEKISQLSMYSCPALNNPYTIKTTDWFIFAVNKSFPSSLQCLEKAETLINENDLSNVVLLENTYVVNNIEDIADEFEEDELKEFNESVGLDDHVKSEKLDNFLAKHKSVTHIKVCICSNSLFILTIFIGKHL